MLDRALAEAFFRRFEVAAYPSASGGAGRSHRLIGRESALSKNTVAAIVKWMRAEPLYVDPPHIPV
jgi:hypothetical protein